MLAYVQDPPSGTDKLRPRDSNPEKPEDTAEMPFTTTQLSTYSNLEEFSTLVEEERKGKLGLHVIRTCVEHV